MRTERSEPILPARNLDETRAFYEKLGFVPWWRGRGPWEYEIVSRGHLVVHFFAEPGMTPSENDMSCYAPRSHSRRGREPTGTWGARRGRDARPPAERGAEPP